MCYAGGYSLGHTNKISSREAIAQQPQHLPEAIPTPQVTPTKNEVIKQTRIIVRRRAYRIYIQQEGRILVSFPIAIGKPGWETPPGDYQVIRMSRNPTFKNFRTGEIIHPGVGNPLGKRLIVFKRGQKFDLAIHGTNQNELIGQAVSHGCIRMHNKDVTKLYDMVDIGTPVTVLP